ESADMISPPNRRATATPSALLPDAFVPTIATALALLASRLIAGSDLAWPPTVKVLTSFVAQLPARQSKCIARACSRRLTPGHRAGVRSGELDDGLSFVLTYGSWRLTKRCLRRSETAPGAGSWTCSSAAARARS